MKKRIASLLLIALLLVAMLPITAQAAANDFCRADFDADAPEPVRLAIQLMAAHFYEYRDSSDKAAYATMLSAFHALLYPYRVIEEMF